MRIRVDRYPDQPERSNALVIAGPPGPADCSRAADSMVPGGLDMSTTVD